MLRKIIAIVTCVVIWGVVVTAINLSIRHGWPAYAAVEKAMTFTLAMMLARLAESAVSSLASGWVAARIGGCWAALITGLILLGIFVPIHIQIWKHFPIWYHLTFLTSLPLLSLVGGRFTRR